MSGIGCRIKSESPAECCRNIQRADFYDLRDQLIDTANELSRISKLLNQYSPGLGHSLKENIKENCNNLFSLIDSKLIQTDPGKALYKCRALFFHNYRLIPPPIANEHLDKIADSMLELSVDILYRYKNKTSI